MYKIENMLYAFGMDRLYEFYRRRLQYTDMTLVREFETAVSWDARLVGIKGARGCGKTTLILQHIKKTFQNNLDVALYVSLDNLYFANNLLLEFVDTFVKHGGTHILSLIHI